MGVVYHANFLVWFEVGRVEYLRALGASYRQLEEEGVPHVAGGWMEEENTHGFFCCYGYEQTKINFLEDVRIICCCAIIPLSFFSGSQQLG